MTILSEQDLKQILAIGADLEKEFMELPSQYGYFAYQFARACDTLRHKESLYDMVHADLYNEARMDLGGNSKEAERKAWIQSREDYKQAVQEVNEAKYTRDILKATLDALSAKKEMLQQLGPMQRADLSNHLGSKRPYGKLSRQDQRDFEDIMKGEENNG